MLSLHRRGRKLRLDRRQLTRQRGAPLGDLLGLGPGALLDLGGAPQSGHRLVLGGGERLERSLRLSAAPLGFGGGLAQARGSRRGLPPRELGQLRLELGDPGGGAGLELRVGAELIEA